MPLLAETLLALALVHAPPGRSPYSVEVMPECGQDPAHPACRVRRLCAEPTLACRRPTWSPSRKVWHRIESRESGTQRYEKITSVLASTAQRLMRCDEDASGSPRADCEPIGWPGTARSLAIATLAVAVHESGLRRDIQRGEGPAGRGPAKEACLVQLAPEEAPKYASWLPESERHATAASRAAREAFAQTLLGESPEALGRCFEIGMRVLARARIACASKPGPWAHGMYSMYGSGHTCRLPGAADTRYRTFKKMMTQSASRG